MMDTILARNLGDSFWLSHKSVHNRSSGFSILMRSASEDLAAKASVRILQVL